jgi:hypothetical protein
MTKLLLGFQYRSDAIDVQYMVRSSLFPCANNGMECCVNDLRQWLSSDNDEHKGATEALYSSDYSVNGQKKVHENYVLLHCVLGDKFFYGDPSMKIGSHDKK